MTRFCGSLLAALVGGCATGAPPAQTSRAVEKGTALEKPSSPEQAEGADADHGLSANQLATMARNAVVEVIAGELYGSGFHIGDGLVVTNVHVIAHAPGVVLRFADKTEATVDSVRTYDEGTDIAVLDCASCAVHSSLSWTRDTLPDVGTQVFAFGNPRGLAFSISDGIIAAIRKEDDATLLQITAPISPGSSGGPVLNQQGVVVGVATWTLNNSQNLNFAVSTQHVARLIQAHPNAMSLADFNKSLVAPKNTKKDAAAPFTAEHGCRGLDAEECYNQCHAGNLEACEFAGARFLIAGEYDRAVAPLRNACEGGRATASVTLGEMVGRGMGGLDKNGMAGAALARRACALWQAGCDSGVGVACFHFGTCMLPGQAFTEDLARSNAYFRKACNLGEGNGCWALATSHSQGRGTRESESSAAVLRKEARRLWEQDCAAGKETACFNLRQRR